MRGHEEKQSDEGTDRSVASGHLCVCVCVEGRGVWMAVRGMCSLSHESPGAEAHHYPGRERAGLDSLFCFYQHHHPCMGKGQHHLTCHLLRIENVSRTDHFLSVEL